MRILITGSNGMLGKALVRVLSQDHELVGLDLSVPESMDGLSDFVKANITDPESCDRTLLQVKPDIVVNAAAWADVDGCESDAEEAYRVNAEGARNVAEAASLAGALFVQISTDFVFDGDKDAPYTEEDAVNPLGVYANSKLKAEELIVDCASAYIIVRTSWLFGPGGKNFVEAILAKASKGEDLKVVNDQVGSPTYTVDLALAIKHLLERVKPPVREIVNVSNSGKCSWYDFAVKILELNGMGGEVSVDEISSEGLNRPAKRPLYSELDTGKFSRITGSKMRTWQEALEDYMKERDDK